MRTVSHREMRNNSAALLRAVEAGESITVTNRGRPVAVVAPYVEGVSEIERLRSRGETRPPQASVQRLRDIQRVQSDLTSAEIVADSRGRW